MATFPWRLHERAGQVTLLAINLLVCSLPALAETGTTPGFPLRNQNPFLQIFGLPPFQSAFVASAGTTSYDLSLDVANHADAGENTLEQFVSDGETYFLTLSLRRGISKRLELGIDLPVVVHREGFLDPAIERWHDTFGLSNTKRRGPGNQLEFAYTGPGTASYRLSSPSSGIGDIQLTAAVPLRRTTASDGLSVAVRSGIKLPTGSADELHGSGAADFSLGIYASGRRLLWKRDLDISGFAGALLLGDGDVLSDIQRSTVPYGGIAATWHATERLGLTTQLSAQGAYFDSELEELGGDSLQLAVGGDYRLPAEGMSLRFAIVEDVSANATTDFALHFSFRTVPGR